MNYAYYPGCSLHGSAREYDESTRAVCEALGIGLQEIPGWSCCGASSAHMTSELLGLALPVRNLLLARPMAMDVLTCCAACYGRLKVANHTMASDGNARVERVDRVVQAPYRGEVGVTHLLQVLGADLGPEAIRERAVRDLAGLRVACYYGCLLVRPPEVVAFDDPENPVLMDRLMESVGAYPVDWPHKTECCGGSLSLTRTEVVLKLCHDILELASDAGAECLVVACPLCQANLDMRQGQIARRYGRSPRLPILYLTQLIGLALGIEERALGLDRLVVSPRKLLHERELV